MKISETWVFRMNFRPETLQHDFSWFFDDFGMLAYIAWFSAEMWKWCIVALGQNPKSADVGNRPKPIWGHLRYIESSSEKFFQISKFRKTGGFGDFSKFRSFRLHGRGYKQWACTAWGSKGQPSKPLWEASRDAWGCPGGIGKECLDRDTPLAQRDAYETGWGPRAGVATVGIYGLGQPGAAF